jgi:hypothetical protein
LESAAKLDVAIKEGFSPGKTSTKIGFGQKQSILAKDIHQRLMT